MVMPFGERFILIIYNIYNHILTYSLYPIQAVLYAALTMILIKWKYYINSMLRIHQMTLPHIRIKCESFKIAGKAFYNLDPVFLSKFIAFFFFSHFSNAGIYVAPRRCQPFRFIHCKHLHLLLLWFLMPFISLVQLMNLFILNHFFLCSFCSFCKIIVAFITL